MSNAGIKKFIRELLGKRWKPGLRERMMFGFGLLFAGALTALQLAREFGVPWLGFEGEVQQHQRLAFEHLNVIADLQHERLEAWLHRRTDQARRTSESRLLKTAVADLAGRLQAREEADLAAWFRTQLAPLPIHQALTHDLRLTRTAHEPYERVAVADAESGLILASTDPADLGAKAAGLAWFTNALGASLEEAVGLEQDIGTGRQRLVISRPVTVAGKRLAVMMLAVNLAETLSRVLHQGPAWGQTTETVLVDQQGQIRFAAHLQDDAPRRRFTCPDDPAGQGSPNAAAGHIQRARDYRGVMVLATCRKIEVAPGIDWRLIAKQDEREILAPLHASGRHTLLLEFLGLALVLGLSSSVAGHLAQPLQALCRTVERVHGGDLEARAPVPRQPELNLLATTFNALADRVLKWREELEGEVRARTVQWQTANALLEAEVARRRQAEDTLRHERDNFRNVMNSMEDGVYIVGQDYSIQYLNPALQREFGPTRDRKCYQYFHARSDPCPWCKAPEVWAGKNVRWEWESPRSGKIYDLLDTPLRNPNGSASKLEIFRDITEQKAAQRALRSAQAELEGKVRERTAALVQANAALQAEVSERARAEAALRRANRALRALWECNQALMEAGEEAELLDRICSLMLHTGAYARAWVGFAEEGRPLRIRPAAQAGFRPGYLESSLADGNAVGKSCGSPVQAIRSCQPVLCRRSPDQSCCYCRAEECSAGHMAALAVPLSSPGQCLGVLMIYASSAEAFDDQEVQLLLELGKNLAYGILALRTRSERKSLEARILEISDREQQRIGRDLHDGLCQELAGISYLCNAARETIVLTAPGSAAMLERVLQLLGDTMAQAHGLARGLQPVSMGADGLMSALDQLAAYFGQVYGVKARFVCSSPVLLEHQAPAIHLYRIAQEAMYNAVKHGRATRIIVRLWTSDQTLTLSITDNGCGIPEPFARSAGLGLETMRFRAQSLGGRLQIQRSATGGTCVTCGVPLPIVVAGRPPLTEVLPSPGAATPFQPGDPKPSCACSAADIPAPTDGPSLTAATKGAPS